MRAFLVAVALSLAVCGRGEAGPGGLKGGAITDQATRVCVPVADDLLLSVALPPHFWVQCPRNARIPTSLDGDGVIAQYITNLSWGGTHGLLYVGSVPLSGGKAAAASAGEVEKAARDFLADLRNKYARVDIGLVTDPFRIALEKTFLKVDGKRCPAWRTTKYATKVTGPVSGPSPAFKAEAVLFAPPGADSLAYVVMDGKLAAPALDRVIEGLTTGRAAALFEKPYPVQLNDVSIGALEGFPIRLAAFSSPAGFAPTRLLMRVPEEFVWTADRVDESGRTLAAIKIEHRDPGGGGIEKEADHERITRKIDPAAPRVPVDLATPGVKAVVFTWTETVGERKAPVKTAVFQLEDKVWTLSLWSYGDAAAQKTDFADFDALLASTQLALR
jgi:hypothetical protein